MDIASLLALVNKGITVATTLIQAGKDAAPAFAALKELVGNRTTAPTQAEQEKVDKALDDLLDEFNLELPPE